jgi:hypothetical protein
MLCARCGEREATGRHIIVRRGSEPAQDPGPSRHCRRCEIEVGWAPWVEAVRAAAAASPPDPGRLASAIDGLETVREATAFAAPDATVPADVAAILARHRRP